MAAKHPLPVIRSWLDSTSSQSQNGSCQKPMSQASNSHLTHLRHLTTSSKAPDLLLRQSQAPFSDHLTHFQAPHSQLPPCAALETRITLEILSLPSHQPFIAPQVATTYTFSLRICVTGSTTQCNTKTTTITVPTKASNAAITDKVESFTWVSSQSGTISVSCRSNVIDGTASTMTLFATALNGGSVSMVRSTGDPGLFTYQSRSVKNPGSVSCTSNLGGTSGTQIATAKKRSVLRRAPGKFITRSKRN